MRWQNKNAKRKMAKKVWDLERLIDDADSFRIAENLGIRTRRFGKTTFVECVSGSHPETRLDHCKLFRNGCHCFSCGASFSSYGMVKAYMENVQGRCITHDEICEILAESTGNLNADDYLIRGGNDSNRKRFPLTRDELQLIGLLPKGSNRIIVGFSEEKCEEFNEPVNGGYAKTALLPRTSIYSLFEEDEVFFWEMVKNKTEEKFKSAEKWVVDTIIDLPLATVKKEQNGLLKPGFKMYASLKRLRKELPDRQAASMKQLKKAS